MTFASTWTSNSYSYLSHSPAPPLLRPFSPMFTHLHVHSHYSLLGGVPSVEQLVTRAARDGLKALALTDHNALYGAVAFDRACRAAGIKPIIGLTAVLPPPDNTPALDSPDPGQITLLATGPEGYRSLCRLSSLLQGSPERQAQPILRWEELKANATGLICLDGGQKGWLYRLMRAGDAPAAARYAGRLGSLFEENGYIGLEWQRDGDTAVLREASAIANRFGLRPVVAQPVYCLDPADAPLLRLLAAIDGNCPVTAVPFDDQLTYHWLTPDQIAARFAAFPEAITAVADIIAQCHPALPDGRPLWPALNLPEETTIEEVLAEESMAGLMGREPYSVNREPYSVDREPYSVSRESLGEHGTRNTEYGLRLLNELAAINQRGFAPSSCSWPTLSASPAKPACR
jgi:DNA polymerase III subunit alpha